MTTKQEYKEKIEAEISQLQHKLDAVKQEAKSQAASARVKYDEVIDNMQHQIENARGKLNELSNAAEGAWDKMKCELEDSWSSVKNMFSAAIDKIKK